MNDGTGWVRLRWEMEEVAGDLPGSRRGCVPRRLPLVLPPRRRRRRLRLLTTSTDTLQRGAGRGPAPRSRVNGPPTGSTLSSIWLPRNSQIASNWSALRRARLHPASPTLAPSRSVRSIAGSTAKLAGIPSLRTMHAHESQTVSAGIRPWPSPGLPETQNEGASWRTDAGTPARPTLCDGPALSRSSSPATRSPHASPSLPA